MWGSKRAIYQHIERSGRVLTKHHVIVGGIATAGVIALTAVTWQAVAEESNTAPNRTAGETATNETKAEVRVEQPSAQSDILPSVEQPAESNAAPEASQPSSIEPSAPSVDVSINGQPQTVPANGSFHSSTVTDDGNTKLDVSIDSHSTGDDRSRSSTRINVNSSTRTSVETQERVR